MEANVDEEVMPQDKVECKDHRVKSVPEKRNHADVKGDDHKRDAE